MRGTCRGAAREGERPCADCDSMAECVRDEILHVFLSHAEENDTDERAQWLKAKLVQLTSYVHEHIARNQKPREAPPLAIEGRP